MRTKNTNTPTGNADYRQVHDGCVTSRGVNKPLRKVTVAVGDRRRRQRTAVGWGQKVCLVRIRAPKTLREQPSTLRSNERPENLCTVAKILFSLWSEVRERRRKERGCRLFANIQECYLTIPTSGTRTSYPRREILFLILIITTPCKRRDKQLGLCQAVWYSPDSISENFL